MTVKELVVAAITVVSLTATVAIGLGLAFGCVKLDAATAGAAIISGGVTVLGSWFLRNIGAAAAVERQEDGR